MADQLSGMGVAPQPGMLDLQPPRDPERTTADARRWTELVEHLSADVTTPGEGLGRIAERVLQRPLTTREYVAVQDLADVSAQTAEGGRLGELRGACVDLLETLGEAVEPGSGFDGGVRLLVEVRRVWRR